MFEILKNANLLIMPDWLSEAIEAHGMKPMDIVSVKGLESILSGDDVRFYRNQVDNIVNNLNGESRNGTNPVTALLDSLTLLHTNSYRSSLGGSVEPPVVKINRLYGKSLVEYDFFENLNMVPYLPRSLQGSMGPNVRVDPYIELASTDLFVLKFTTDLYRNLPLHEGYPSRPNEFTRTSLKLLLANYGFDRVAPTKLFELYTLVPEM